MEEELFVRSVSVREVEVEVEDAAVGAKGDIL